jgi:hypothetical protein
LLSQTFSANNAFVSNNIYYDGSFKYAAAGNGVLMYLNEGDGSFKIRTAPSGSAGATATLTERFTVTNTGNVGIGTTSPSELLSVSSSGGDSAYFAGEVGIGAPNPSSMLHINSESAVLLVEDTSSGVETRISASNSTGFIGTNSNNTLEIGTNAIGHITVTSSSIGIFDGGPDATLEIVNDGTGDSFLVADTNDGDTTPFVIRSTGNVGIGTTNPGAKLQVAGGAVVLDYQQYFQGKDSGGTARSLLGMSSGDIIDLGLVNYNVRIASGGADVLLPGGIWKQSGSIGIGTTTPWRKLSVSGTVGFDGLTGSTGAGSLCLSASKQVVYNSASDSCLPSLRETKHDIAALALSATEVLSTIEPVSFIYNESDGRVRYGFIAEDVAAVDPHLATYNASSTISGIDDRAMVSLLVKGFKEVWNEVVMVKNSVVAVTSRVDEHDREIAELKARIAALESTQAPEEGEEETPTDTTPPTITITGNNPAQLTVGDSYADLGAIAIDDSGTAILRTYVRGIEVTAVSIDTSVAGEHAVVYVATDLAGNSATSTRAVVVEEVILP